MELEGREEKNGGLDFERHMTCMYEFCKQFLIKCFCTYAMFDKEFILEVTTDWTEQLLMM